MLMCNSVFGKTMEYIRNHKDRKLVTSKQKYQNYVMNPNFKNVIHFPKIYLPWRWEKPRLR